MTGTEPAVLGFMMVEIWNPAILTSVPQDVEWSFPPAHMPMVLGYGMNRRFWQDSGVLGHGDRIRKPSVKNYNGVSVHESIPMLSDIAMLKKDIAFVKSRVSE